MVIFRLISVMSFEMHCMSTLGKHRCSDMARYRLYGPRMGPTDNFSLVTGSKPAQERLNQPEFNEAIDSGVAVASAGSYAIHLHLAADR